MTNILKSVLNFVAFLILADFFILSIGIAQIAVEGRTGYWNGWWMWQANAVVGFLK